MTEVPNTRARIVAAGVQLVDTEGLSAVGLRSIARHAGVSHGAPRRYFLTHRNLLASIASVGLSDLKKTMTPALSGNTANTSDALVTAALAYVEYARQRPAMFELLFRHDLLEGGGEDLRDHTIPMLGAVEQLLHGIMGADTAHHRALLLWTAIHGIAMLTATRALDVFDADLVALVTDAVEIQLRDDRGN